MDLFSIVRMAGEIDLFQRYAIMVYVAANIFALWPITLLSYPGYQIRALRVGWLKLKT